MEDRSKRAETSRPQHDEHQHSGGHFGFLHGDVSPKTGPTAPWDTEATRIDQSQ